jgi:hypothetical protein
MLHAHVDWIWVPLTVQIDLRECWCLVKYKIYRLATYPVKDPIKGFPILKEPA